MLGPMAPATGNETAPDTGGGPSVDLDSAVVRWGGFGLARYLEDVDLAAELVDWLHRETGVNKGALKLAMKLLSPAVSATARRATGWLSDRAKERVVAALTKLPFYDRLAGALDRVTVRLDENLAAKREVEEILAGRRPPHDTAFANALTLDLQAQVSTLQRLDDVSGQIADGFANIETLLTPQPVLTLRLFAPNEGLRFFYGAQRVPFVGRDDELARLAEFLYAGERFSWWLVAGPAGTGKSRLALELCLRHGNAWRVGMLSSADAFTDWGNWRPDQPTLIVADYVSERAEDLHSIALALAENQGLDFPVRLLLVERDSEGYWWPAFRGAGGERYVIDAARHTAPLTLGRLDDAALERMIASVIDDAGPTLMSPRQIVAAVRAIDPEARPLFVAFVADAVAAGRDPRAWDREALLGDVLEREDARHWQPAGISDGERNLLALATMTGGLDVGALASIKAPDLIPPPSAYDPHRYRVLSGQASEDRLAPYEPDILGELFVLERLRPAHTLDTDRAEAMRALAWSRSALGMATFLSHAAMDFPRHPTLRILDRPAGENGLTRRLWSLAAANLIIDYGSAGDIAEARALYDAIAGLAADHPDEPALREHQARGAVHLMAHYGTAGDIAEARALYDAIAGLAADHASEPALRERQARGAVNLIIPYGNAGDIAEARALYDAIAGLTAAHPGEPALREGQARGAFNLIVHYGSAGNIAEARALYGAIAGIAAAHPDEPALREEQAKGAFNLIVDYGTAGDIAEAHALYDAIAGLAAAHPGEPALREEQAKGAVNLIFDYGNAGDIAEARALYDTIAGLAAAHPDEPALRELQAGGAVNLIFDYGNAGDIAEARALYDTIAGLAAAHRGEPALRERQAMGAVNLIAHYGSAGDIAEARAFYDAIAGIAAAHWGEPALREEQAKGAFNLMHAYGRAGNIAEARAFYDAIAGLATAHPGEPALRERQAGGAVNLIVDYGNAGDIAEARALYDAIAGIAAAHPDEPALREQQARGAFNLMNAYGSAGNIAEARALYDAIAGLAAAHRGEPALREEQAKGAVNLIVDYGNAGDIAEARALYEAIAGLAAAHPGEPALRELQARGAVNLIANFGSAGHIAEARALYDAIAGLAAAHPGEPALSELQARGAFNLIVDYGTAGDIAEARALYDAIAGLAAAHPGEPALRELQARGAVNLIAAYRKAGQSQAAEEFLSSLSSEPDLVNLMESFVRSQGDGPE